MVIALGVVLALSGIAMLGWCMLRAQKLRSAELDEAEAEAALKSLIFYNMAGVGTGFFGLAITVVGLLLF